MEQNDFIWNCLLLISNSFLWFFHHKENINSNAKGGMPLYIFNINIICFVLFLCRRWCRDFSWSWIQDRGRENLVHSQQNSTGNTVEICWRNQLWDGGITVWSPDQVSLWGWTLWSDFTAFTSPCWTSCTFSQRVGSSLFWWLPEIVDSKLLHAYVKWNHSVHALSKNLTEEQ